MILEGFHNFQLTFPLNRYFFKTLSEFCLNSQTRGGFDIENQIPQYELPEIGIRFHNGLERCEDIVVTRCHLLLRLDCEEFPEPI